MKKIIDYFIPNSLRENLQDYERAKLLVSILSINFIAIVFSIPTIMFGKSFSLIMLISIIMFIFLLASLLFSFKREKLSFLTVSNIMLTCSTILINISLFMPEAQANSSQFFVLMPLLALLLLGSKRALVWLILVNINKVICTLILLQNSKVLDPVGEIVNFIIFSFIIFFVSKVFESSRIKIELELEKEKLSIENRVKDAINEIELKNSEILISTKKSEEINAQLELKQNDILLAFQEAENSRQELENNKHDLEDQKRTLQTSVEQMLNKMEKFAKGDLTVNIDSGINKNNTQVITELFDGFNDSVLNINKLFKLLVKAITDVEDSSSDISLLTEELSAGTEEQLSQISQISSFVEEFALISEKNNETILKTSETSQQNKSIANLGGELVLETVDMMNDISTIVNETLQKVSALGKSTQQINEVSSFINAIASQTNLLALNTAIEAARAGEHGRGFSVIADEVRKLAEKTSFSSTEIMSMIKIVQNQTNDLITIMNKANDKVFNGIKLANRAGETLEKIVITSEDLLKLIDHVSMSSKEQANTSKEVVKNILEIESVSNKAVNNILKISDSVNDLNKLSTTLKDISNNFKTE
ncbi:MAG: methyl-accepting chemotaxis protein [Cyanobacteriota bacterium]